MPRPGYVGPGSVASGPAGPRPTRDDRSRATSSARPRAFPSPLLGPAEARLGRRSRARPSAPALVPPRGHEAGPAAGPPGRPGRPGKLRRRSRLCFDPQEYSVRMLREDAHACARDHVRRTRARSSRPRPRHDTVACRRRRAARRRRRRRRRAGRPARTGRPGRTAAGAGCGTSGDPAGGGGSVTNLRCVCMCVCVGACVRACVTRAHARGRVRVRAALRCAGGPGRVSGRGTRCPRSGRRRRRRRCSGGPTGWTAARRSTTCGSRAPVCFKFIFTNR